MENELENKQQAITELSHEIATLEDIVKTLRNKLNECNERKQILELQQLDFMKIKEKIAGMKIYLNKIENELNDAKKDQENRLIQVKERVNKREKYAKKN